MIYIFPYQKKFYVLRKTPILLSRFREFWKDRTTKCVFDEKSFGKFRRKRKWDKNWISSENSTKMFKILFIRYMETCLVIIIFKWRHQMFLFHEKKNQKLTGKKALLILMTWEIGFVQLWADAFTWVNFVGHEDMRNIFKIYIKIWEKNHLDISAFFQVHFVHAQLVQDAHFAFVHHENSTFRQAVKYKSEIFISLVLTIFILSNLK